MEIIEVTASDHVRQFLQLPLKIYEKYPYWIQPLKQDMEGVFDKKKNKTYQHGECIRWILKDKGDVIGRVAAFVNTKTATKGNEQPTGGIGFFECIEDKTAAFKLFDQCKTWLQSKGMEAMDGPINFGNRDRWWGLLIEGYDREPNYQCNYNPPYYKDFFEAYGFQVYFYQFTFGRPMDGPLDEKLYAKAALIEKDPNYKFSYVPKSDKTLADKIKYVYNKAWASRGEIPELTTAQAKHIVKQMKPIMDEKLLWFGYYKDEPIAFFLSLPEVNQVFKHVNGNLNWLGKLKFLWHHRLMKTNKKAYGILFGVVPEHHGRGVDGAIIESFRRIAQKDTFQYKEYEMNWIGDFNPKMIRVAEQVTPNVIKRHATYRKLFDESKPFKRMPIVK